MRSAELHLGGRSLAALAAVVGRRWELVTGEPLGERPGHWFAWDDAVVATDGGSVRIHIDRIGLDFEGYVEEYSFLSATADDRGLAAARAAGRVCTRHGGQRIRGIAVVREEITAILHGEPRWRFSTDYGVVVSLEAGAVAVAKASHRTGEALISHVADRPEAVDIADRSIEWTSDAPPGEEYQVRRVLIPMAEPLPAGP